MVAVAVALVVAATAGVLIGAVVILLQVGAVLVAVAKSCPHSY